MSKFFDRTIRKKNKKNHGEGGDDDTGEPSDTAAADGVGPLEFPADCEGGASGTDLIFVHGLRGSRLKSWSTGDVFWPRDLLKDDVKNIRVITWGYDASVANAFTYASKESIFGHADTLLSDLARLRRGITRPIVFICHSLGGLVVKEPLIKSAAYNSHRRHPALGEIFSSSIGVIFLGTPHRGSSRETLGEVVANVAQLSFRRPNKQLLRTLKPDSHFLEHQRDQFTTISSNLSIICIREELPTGVGMIVKEASASYDGFNVRRDTINANHMNMIRFPSKGAEGYKRILGHIDDICNVQRADLQQENEENKTRENDIISALKFSTIHDRELDIDNAYAQSCSWIIDHQSTNNRASAKESQFLSWLKNDETFFWISGKAGCGKSTLMKHVYQNSKTKEELSQWADGKGLVLIGYFFFDRGDKHQKSREGMLKSILYQVLSTRRDLIRKIFSQFFGNNLPLPERFTSWVNLSGALISMLDFLRDSKICIFLDGLDEYRMIDKVDEYTEEEMDLIYDGTNEDDGWGRSTWITGGHREIAKFLRQFKDRGNVKVCISSRELVVFEQEFRNFARLQVHEHTAESIARYCEGRLTDEAPSLVDRSEFVSLVTEKSRGVFLWVRLVVDMLVDGNADGNSKKELLQTLNNLPPRLGGKDGLYMRMMQNIKREYLPESKRLFQLAMIWSGEEFKGPLDIITLFLAEPGHLEADSQELRARNDEVLFKSWEESRPQWTDLQYRLKSRCGGLLEGTKNVQFMHQTAKEFMSRKYLWDKIFHRYIGFVGGSDLDLAMLSGLIRRLKCCGEAVIKLDDLQYPEDLYDPLMVDHKFSGRHDKFSIPERSIELLDSALDYASTVSESETAIISTTLDGKDELPQPPRRFHATNPTWVEILLVPRYTRSGLNLKPRSFLEIALIFGLIPYVEAKIKGEGIPRSQLQSLLLRAARFVEHIWRGQMVIYFKSPNPELSEMLLQEGADPNYRDEESNAAMASEECWTIWTSLLQDGLIEDDLGWQNWTSTVKVFLKYGADPTVRWHKPHDKRGGHADIATPQTVINAVFAKNPGLKQDLVEIMDLLSEAKSNWGLQGTAPP